MFIHKVLFTVRLCNWLLDTNKESCIYATLSLLMYADFKVRVFIEKAKRIGQREREKES